MDKDNPARMLALKLYAMHSDDREWILARVDPVAKFHLTALLEELSALDIQVDIPILASIEEGHPAANQRLAGYTEWLPAEHAMAIDSATASTIHIIFDQEPDIFLRCLNALHPWKWNAGNDAVALHHADHDMQIVPVAVKQALVKAVSNQLSAWENMRPQVVGGSKHVIAPPRKDFILKRIFAGVF
jgi:hypothetical protein